jgi:hypothetical protein
VHDDVPRSLAGVSAGGHDHVVVLLGDRAHRAAQAKRIEELCGHPLRHEARAAVHQALLRAVLDREEGLEAVVPSHEHEQVEERHLVEVAGVEATDRHVEQVAGDLCADARCLEVLADRRRVPLGGPRRRPRLLERHLLGQAVDPPLRPGDRGDGERADLGDETLVRAAPAAADEQVLAGHVRLVDGHPHLRGQSVGGIVLRAQPPATAVDGHAARPLLRPDPPADAVPRLEHGHALTALDQPSSGGQPGVPRADDADVGIHPLGHRAEP